MPKARITVLAPYDVVGVVEEISRETGKFKLRSDAYSDSREIVDLFHRHSASSDAVLIGGPLAYDYLMEQLAGSPELTRIVVGFVPYDGTAIFRALFEMARERSDIDLDAMRLSIDHPAGEHIRECVDEINLGVANTFSKECISAEDVAGLVTFHADLWRRQQVTAAMTSVHCAYERLRELSVPVYRIYPSKSAIRSALTALEDQLQKKRVQDQQIATVAIRFIDAVKNGESTDARSIINRRRLLIDRRLEGIAEQLSGVVQWTKAVEACILTTRRHVEQEVFSVASEHLISSFRQDFGVDLAIVIGIADTVKEALALARNIHEQEDFKSGEGVWVVDPDGIMQHSAESDIGLHYASWSNNADLVEKAGLANIGIASINRVLAFAERNHCEHFSARQLADWMDITPRSARRIIGRMEKIGLIKKCGARQSAGRGRPTQLYRKAGDML